MTPFRIGAVALVMCVWMSGAGASSVSSPVAGEVSCECQNSSCGPCETETGVSFYSAKCGPANERVKSCKKPSCAPVENQQQCLAKLGIQPATVSKPVERAVASQKPEIVRAGVIEDVTGIVRLIRANGVVETPEADLPVYVGDIFETKTNGKIRIRFKDGSTKNKGEKSDGSEMTVAANSRVVIDNVEINGTLGSRKIALDLVMGKVRNVVKKKYEGENSFVVKTKTAVAGVRGTDFVASYEQSATQWVSEVRTIEGFVQLESVRPRDADPSKPMKSVGIPGGTYAAFIVGPPSKVDDDAAFFKSIEDGQISPVIKMRDEEIRALKDATEIASVTEKQPSARSRSGSELESDQICAAPVGKFNQCSFTCEGNPPGQNRCRTDLAGVACVRRLCRANGAWVEPTRMPASEAGRCRQTGRSIVGDCGGYW